jgi:tetratricopeptide (TPR) repeat protein
MMRVLSASISLWSGRTDDAVGSAETAVALFEEIDDHIGELQARCGLGRALLMSGQVEAGIAELQDALARGSGPLSDDQQWMARVSMLMSAVQLGDVDLGAAALTDSHGFAEADSVGFGDRVGALALHHLQQGEVEEASAVLDDEVEPRGYVQCARALVLAVQGDLEATECAADELAVVPHTYLDRAYAEIGRAIALAAADRAGDARAVLATAIAEVDATGDRLAQAIVRLVDATVAEQAHRPDAATARSVAEARLQDLGIHATGWRHLLQDALGLVSAS